jgi:2-polyprenyl-3-methyl-5-hydroxy-6-metoxy-1,4-benzoquinol methylase
VADAIFTEPRLAEIYDPLDPDRSDLDAYAAMAAEWGAQSVLDVGCGTGTLACLLARRGVQVTGIDPAAASLAVARRKPARTGSAGCTAQPRPCPGRRRRKPTWRP